MSSLLTIILLGLLASISPTTLIAFTLLLSTTRARANAAAFLVGWTISLVVVFAVSYSIGGSHSVKASSGRSAVLVAEVALGIALLWLAQHSWRRRNRPIESRGSLNARIDRLTPKSAVVLGIFEQPWSLTAAAAIIIVRDHTAFVLAIVAFAIFTIVSTATVLAIYVVYARQPGEAEARLDALRTRLTDLGPKLLAVVSLVAGICLTFDGAIRLVAK